MSEETTTTTTDAAIAAPNTGTASPMMVDAPQVITVPSTPAPVVEVSTEIDKAAADATEESTDAAAPDVSALQAQIAALQQAQADGAGQLQKHEVAMRDTLLSKLGVMEKFRQYAPKVDPFTDEGRAQLETWAQNNSELLEHRPSAAPPVDVAALKSKMRSPHLVDLGSFVKSMKGV